MNVQINAAHWILTRLPFTHTSFPQCADVLMWSSTCCWKKFPSCSDIFWQTSDHVPRCCCFCSLPCVDWLSCSSRARLVCDWCKSFVARDDPPTFSRYHSCSCCSCHYYEKNRSNPQHHTHHTPVFIHALQFLQIYNLLGYSSLNQKEQDGTYSQDNYCFSKQTCVSQS